MEKRKKAAKKARRKRRKNQVGVSESDDSDLPKEPYVVHDDPYYIHDHHHDGHV